MWRKPTFILEVMGSGTRLEGTFQMGNLHLHVFKREAPLEDSRQKQWVFKFRKVTSLWAKMVLNSNLALMHNTTRTLVQTKMQLAIEKCQMHWRKTSDHLISIWETLNKKFTHPCRMHIRNHWWSRVQSESKKSWQRRWEELTSPMLTVLPTSPQLLLPMVS